MRFMPEQTSKSRLKKSLVLKINQIKIEIGSSVLFDCIKISQFWQTSNATFPNSTGPWPQLQKGRKIPVIVYISEKNKTARHYDLYQCQETSF